MVKKFDIAAKPLLSSVIDSIESSLQCAKYYQEMNRIQICTMDDIIFQGKENKELAEKGFGACLVKSYGPCSWDVCIVINIDNCTKANLTEREIAAVILHELGHILNEPELKEVPTFEFCFIHGIQFSKEVQKQVWESNSLTMEVFADAYANRHGFGKELISTFHKQDNNSDQKVKYASTRIDKILNKEYFEGKIMSPQYK